MSYYQNTITEDMLKQVVAGEVNTNIEKIRNAIMKRYNDYSREDEETEDEEIDSMYADMEKMEKTKNSMPNWHDMEEEPALQKKWMMKVINAGLFKPKHGDGFHWLGDGYRNQNLWFWDKDKGIIPPYTEIDDYGGVPPRFLVGNGEDQFLPNNWENIVDHNSFVFLAPELVEEIKSTAKSVTKIHKYTNKPYTIWHTSIMIKENAYAVQICMDDISKIDNVFEYQDGKLVKEC